MPESTRLRTHPQQRFDASAHLLDLGAIAESLRAEHHDAVSGHRQIAIYKHGQATIVLYAFEAGGEMAAHDTEGVVTIHVLNGELSVTVGTTTHDVGSGQVLALAPGVRHSVRASEPGEMLLTVHFAGA
ncbi:MAG: cupin domain-containing protein [Gemmatimonadales bacterium]